VIKIKGVITLIVIIIVSFVGCNSKDTLLLTSEENSKIQVTTTTGQVADIVKNVGGDLVDVKALMGPNIDPHLYQASQSDIGKLEHADIIFYNGLHLEGKMEGIFQKIKEVKPTFAVGEAVPKDKLQENKDNPSVPDPHIWFDIDLWVYAVETVKDGLIEIDAKNASIYEKNTEIYLETLMELKKYTLEKVEEIPEEQRVLITAHDAFNYFGKAYGIEVKGLQGLSTDSEYGLRDVQDLIDTIVERHIKAVFTESSISERSIQAVIEGVTKKGGNVTLGGELFSDAMGEEGTEEGTYVGMYRHNVDTIVNALK
jgi:manganese/zinc/iron transport system substrate-binding protein